MKSGAIIVLFLFVSSLAHACPACLGKDNGGYLDRIFIPVATFLILPFIIFIFVLYLVKRFSKITPVSKQ